MLFMMSWLRWSRDRHSVVNSPTVNVGYEVVSELPKEQHDSPMLSLDKTKEIEALRDFQEIESVFFMEA